MDPTEKARFDSLYPTHLRALKLRGFRESTLDVYSRVVRRVFSPITTAPYAQLTPTTDQMSLTIINRLMNTLTVDFKRR